MHNQDEGSMPYELGETAFNAVFGSIESVLVHVPEWIQYALIILAILVAVLFVFAFFRKVVNDLRERDAEQDRLDQEALLDLAHRGELPHGG